MSFRRMLLIALLTVLGAGAAVACLALVTGNDRTVPGCIMSAVFFAIAIGLFLPLTLLTDRPRFRLAGIACMILVGLSLFCTLGLFWAELTRMGYYYRDIFGMLFGFTLLTGIPAAGALFLVSYRWARWSVWTLVSLAAFAYLFCIVGVIVHVATSAGGRYGMYRLIDSLLATGLFPYGIGALGALLLVNVGCGDRRYFRWPAIACAAFASLLAVDLVWNEPRRDIWYRVLAILITLPAVAAHTNLVLMARVRASLNWFVLLTFVTGLVTGLLSLIGFIFFIRQEYFFRLAGAMGVATACCSLALIVLVFFNRKTGVPNLATTPMNDMDLTCPRCGQRQTLAVGDSVCNACELKISISVVEPRCPGCGYLLFRLTSDRCPECGAVVRGPRPEPPVPAPVAPIPAEITI